jgi:hypothetical protein
MRLRLIGLGDAGELVLAGCCRYFQSRGLNQFLERRVVLKITTGPFALAANALTGLAGMALQTPQERLEMRRGLAYLFFGGQATAQGVRDRLGHLRNPDKAPPEERSALHQLRQVEARLQNAESKQAFWNLLDFHLSDPIVGHVPAVAAQNDWLEPDNLLAPDQPLLNAAFTPNAAIIGRELCQAFLLDQRRRWRLLDGLGHAGSRLDVVVVAFSLNQSFGGEGAEVIARAVRRVLEYPEANRIVAVLGFGVHDAASNLDGKYVGDYFRADRRGNGFDGLMTRPDGPHAGEQLGQVLAAIALSSDPATLQIDNPDSNQVQRDFGKSLVSFGYAESGGIAVGGGVNGGPLIDLYNAALADWNAHHCLDLAGHPLQQMIAARWGAQPPWNNGQPPV